MEDRGLVIESLVEEWRKYLQSLGAIEAISFQGMLGELAKRLKPVMDSKDPKWLESYQRNVQRFASMAEMEFQAFNRDVYAQLHPSWMGEVVIPDQLYIARKLLELIGDSNPINGVADIGSGPGALTAFLASKGFVRSPITCIDPLPSSLNEGRELAEKLGVNADWIEGCISEASLPVVDQSVDLALAIDSLHWTFHWKRGLGEMARVLRPGGKAFVVYSTYSPRVRIHWMEAKAILANAGLQGITTSLYTAKVSGTPRAVITAIKP